MQQLTCDPVGCGCPLLISGLCADDISFLTTCCKLSAAPAGACGKPGAVAG